MPDTRLTPDQQLDWETVVQASSYGGIVVHVDTALVLAIDARLKALEMLAEAARRWQRAREYAMAAHLVRLPAEAQQEAANALLAAEEDLMATVAKLDEGASG